MTIRTAIIIFAVIFSIGILAIVILPFVLGVGPSSPRPGPSTEEPAAGIEQGLFRSDDGGTSWQSKSWVEGSNATIAGFRVNQIVPDPVDPATFYLLTDGNGLWISRSRGDLWAHVVDEAGALEPTSNILAMAVNPRNRLEWYVAAFQKNRGSVLRSADGGRSFRAIYSVPAERYGVFDIHFDAGRGVIGIATGQGGFLESSDQGRTWRVVRWFADGLVRLMVSPVNPSIRFVATSRGGLFRTQDYGASWVDVTGSYSDITGTLKNQRWLMDQTGALYLGSRHGLLRSSDNGATFETPPIIIPPDALPVLAIAVDPVNSRRILVSANSQIFESRDDGQHWAILTSPAATVTKGHRVTALLMDAVERSVMYVMVQP